jgi:hypothetical protein
MATLAHLPIVEARVRQAAAPGVKAISALLGPLRIDVTPDPAAIKRNVHAHKALCKLIEIVPNPSVPGTNLPKTVPPEKSGMARTSFPSRMVRHRNRVLQRPRRGRAIKLPESGGKRVVESGRGPGTGVLSLPHHTSGSFQIPIQALHARRGN